MVGVTLFSLVDTRIIPFLKFWKLTKGFKNCIGRNTEFKQMIVN